MDGNMVEQVHNENDNAKVSTKTPSLETTGTSTVASNIGNDGVSEKIVVNNNNNDDDEKEFKKPVEKEEDEDMLFQKAQEMAILAQSMNLDAKLVQTNDNAQRKLIQDKLQNQQSQVKQPPKWVNEFGDWFEHQKQHTQEKWEKVVQNIQLQQHQQQQQQKEKQKQDPKPQKEIFVTKSILQNHLSSEVTTSPKNEKAVVTDTTTSVPSNKSITVVTATTLPTATSAPKTTNTSSDNAATVLPSTVLASEPSKEATLDVTKDKEMIKSEKKDDSSATTSTATKTTYSDLNMKEEVGASSSNEVKTPIIDEEVVTEEIAPITSVVSRDDTAYTNNQDDEDDDDINKLEAIVWKRRSGWGKLSLKNGWEKRKIILKDSKISYYSLPRTTSQQQQEAIENEDIRDTDKEEIGPEQQVKQQSAVATTDTFNTNKSPPPKLKWSWEEARLNIEKAKENWTQQLLNNQSIQQWTGHQNLGQSGSFETGIEDHTVPRGIMDIIKDEVSVFCSYGHSGSPTPFSITIMNNSTTTNKISKTAASAVSSYDNTKWILTFLTQSDQMLWLSALSNVVMNHSVNDYNANLIKYSISSGVVTTTTNRSIHVTAPSSSESHHTSPGKNSLPPSMNNTSSQQLMSSNVVPKSLHNEESQHQPKLSSYYFGPTSAIYYPAPPPEDDEIASSSKIQSVRLWKAESMDFSSLKDLSSNQGKKEINDNSDNEGSVITEYEEEYETSSNIKRKAPESFREMLLDNIQNAASSGPGLSLRGNNLRISFVLFNLSLVLAAMSGSMESDLFWFTIVFANAALWLCVVNDDIYNKQQQHDLNKTKEKKCSSMNEKKKIKSKDLSVSSQKMKSDKNKIVPVVEKKKPYAGSTSVKMDDNGDYNDNIVNGHRFHRWSKISSSEFMVRSNGYLTNGKTKIKCPSELYEAVHVDVFTSKKRVPNLYKRVILPKVSFDDNYDRNWHSPDIFVISLAVPTEAPRLGRASDDGEGTTITIYYKMKQSTRDILKKITASDYDPNNDRSEAGVDPQKRVVAAVRLFEEWCRRAPNDPSFQARFKLIPNCHNTKEVGLPSWISKYCGKPVLIKRAGVTGFLSKEQSDTISVIEFDVSLHPFPYLMKQATAYLYENLFKKVLFSIAYVIEGRSDEELPEVLIGNPAKIIYPDPGLSIDADDFLSGKSPVSFEGGGDQLSFDGDIAKFGDKKQPVGIVVNM